MAKTNVERKLWNDTDELDLVSDQPKRGLRGAAGGVYIGPIVGIKPAITEGPTSPTHATTSDQSGGIEDSTGYRESDTYAADGDSGLGTAFAVTGPESNTYYRGVGAIFVQVVTLTGTVDAADEFKLSWHGSDSTTFTAGTDMTAAAMQSSLRTLMGDPMLTVSGTTDAGPFIITHSKSVGAQGLTFTEVTDAGVGFTGTISLPKGGNSGTIAGEGGRALGNDGGNNGSTSGAGSSTTVDNETVTSHIPRPAIGTTNPAEGTVGVIDGTAGALNLDLHANDVTNYGGAEVVVFFRDTPNTNGDGAYVNKGSLDSATAASVVTGLTAGTYAVYVRFLGNAQTTPSGVRAPGPWSARGTIAIT